MAIGPTGGVSPTYAAFLSTGTAVLSPAEVKYDNRNCPICLEPFGGWYRPSLEQPILIKCCNHVIGSRCLRTQTREKNRCPLCRCVRCTYRCREWYRSWNKELRSIIVQHELENPIVVKKADIANPNAGFFYEQLAVEDNKDTACGSLVFQAIRKSNDIIEVAQAGHELSGLEGADPPKHARTDILRAFKYSFAKIPFQTEICHLLLCMLGAFTEKSFAEEVAEKLHGDSQYRNVHSLFLVIQKAVGGCRRQDAGRNAAIDHLMVILALKCLEGLIMLVSGRLKELERKGREATDTVG